MWFINDPAAFGIDPAALRNDPAARGIDPGAGGKAALSLKSAPFALKNALLPANSDPDGPKRAKARANGAGFGNGKAIESVECAERSVPSRAGGEWEAESLIKRSVDWQLANRGTWIACAL